MNKGAAGGGWHDFEAAASFLTRRTRSTDTRLTLIIFAHSRIVLESKLRSVLRSLFEVPTLLQSRQNSLPRSSRGDDDARAQDSALKRQTGIGFAVVQRFVVLLEQRWNNRERVFFSPADRLWLLLSALPFPHRYGMLAGAGLRRSVAGSFIITQVFPNGLKTKESLAAGA
jgi:hypothetical protein